MRRTELRNVVLQPATPGWHCSRMEIAIELRVARSGALLVCSFLRDIFARYVTSPAMKWGVEIQGQRHVDNLRAKHLPF